MNILLKFGSARSTIRFLLTAILLGVTWMLWPDQDNRQALRPPIVALAAPQPCNELRPIAGPYQEALVEKSGMYCVAIDFWQRRLHGAGHSGPGSYRHLIDVGAGDVTIDLANHILHSDGDSSGIFVSLEDNNSASELSTPHIRQKARNVTIKNGVIDLRGYGTAVANFHKWRMYTIDEPIPDSLTGYERTNVVLENLLIKTDNVGIVLEGDGNIIRNCIIESGGSAAITMAGPNGQILNNTIVLTNPFVFGEKKTPRAAIALHQATGTVISGNRIEVKGKSPTSHNIYLNHASKDVRIERNTIVGNDEPVTLVAGSTAMLKNNVFEQRKPWWQF